MERGDLGIFLWRAEKDRAIGRNRSGGGGFASQHAGNPTHELVLCHFERGRSSGAGQRDGLRAIGCEIVVFDRLVAEPQIVAVFRLRREREEDGKRSQEKMFHPIPTAARAGAARKASAIASRSGFGRSLSS